MNKRKQANIFMYQAVSKEEEEEKETSEEKTEDYIELKLNKLQRKRNETKSKKNNETKMKRK